MNIVFEKTLKQRVINRILKYTFIYTDQELINLSLDELKRIQCSLFIGLNVKIIYCNRHK